MGRYICKLVVLTGVVHVLGSIAKPGSSAKKEFEYVRPTCSMRFPKWKQLTAHWQATGHPKVSAQNTTPRRSPSGLATCQTRSNEKGTGNRARGGAADGTNVHQLYKSAKRQQQPPRRERMMRGATESNARNTRAARGWQQPSVQFIA